MLFFALVNNEKFEIIYLRLETRKNIYTTSIAMLSK